MTFSSTGKGQAMSNIARLLDRNQAFAADPDVRRGMLRLPFIPNQNLHIVTCIDLRVDPAQVLGVRLGDAIVQRNIGGRITPAIIRNIA
jgi:carbonic anhydrase